MTTQTISGEAARNWVEAYRLAGGNKMTTTYTKEEAKIIKKYLQERFGSAMGGWLVRNEGLHIDAFTLVEPEIPAEPKARYPLFLGEFTRYVPSGFTPERLMDVIVNFGLMNDTLDCYQADDNPDHWKVKISLEKTRD